MISNEDKVEQFVPGEVTREFGKDYATHKIDQVGIVDDWRRSHFGRIHVFETGLGEEETAQLVRRICDCLNHPIMEVKTDVPGN